jgi:predicted  nucleic acid-binding Zn-ribbon protein
MAEPESVTLEVLKDIRGDMREMRGDVRRVESKLDTLAEHIDDVETKLDGLTHAVIAGFGSIVHELDALKDRVGRLETERA